VPIHPRQWLHAFHYIRGFISATIAPGGLGKTSLQLIETIGMAAGRNLLGGEGARPLNVWYWNLEDPVEEIERRIAAILLHYEIAPDNLDGRLFVNSGRDQPLVIAERQRDATDILVPVVEALKAEIKGLAIDVLIVDPFVSCHRIPENDNPAIDLVVKTWGEIAGSANIAIELAHHVRKPSNVSSGSDFDVYDARGAGSFTQAARSVRVLNTMSKEDAERVKISELDRRAYFRVDRDAKANMKPATQKADWRKFMSVCLNNATADDPADWIGVVIAWKMPGTFDGVETYHLRDVQKIIAGGEWMASPRSPNWAGYAVAEALDLDASDKGDRQRITAMLKTWIANKYLRVTVKTAANRHEKEFVEVGNAA
jgi:hypothetical protein